MHILVSPAQEQDIICGDGSATSMVTECLQILSDTLCLDVSTEPIKKERKGKIKVSPKGCGMSRDDKRAYPSGSTPPVSKQR